MLYLNPVYLRLGLLKPFNSFVGSKFKTTLAGSDSPLSVAVFNKSCGTCLCFSFTFWTLHFLIQSYVERLMMDCFDDPKALGSVGS